LSNLVEETEEEEIEAKQQTPASRAWVLIAAVLVLVAFGGWYFFQKRKMPEPATQQAAPAAQSTNTVVETPPEPAPTPAPPSPAPEPPLSPALRDVKDGNVANAATFWKHELQQHKSRFTIQLVIACESKTVLDAFETLQYSSDAAVVPLKFQGRSCYRVVYGIYPSKDAADRAASDLPAVFLRQTSPASSVPVSKILK
jgi:septal ring-binding cell division protein DamX